MRASTFFQLFYPRLAYRTDELHLDFGGNSAKTKVLKIMSKLYTLEEIKSQNGKNGAKTWIVLHDNVYDVTDYLEDVRIFFPLDGILFDLFDRKKCSAFHLDLL